MKLRNKALLYLLVIHLIMLLLSLTLLEKNKIYFLAAEGAIILSIIVSVIIYKQLVAPLSLISTGISTMEERAFNLKLKKTGLKEWDSLIALYNRMIDDLKGEQVRLREKHYFLEKLIQASPSGIILLDHMDRITMINPSAEKLTGLMGDGVRGKRIDEAPGDFPAALAEMEPESTLIHERGFRIFRCKKASFMDKGYKHHFIFLEELTEEIRRKERKAYEKVIRMMSHEVGNSLGAVNSIIDSTRSWLSGLSSPESREFEKALEIAGRRNDNLNQFMDRFSDVVRLPEPAPIECDLSSLIEETVSLLSPQSADRIKWAIESEGGRLFVQADPRQMEQVMINILLNSIESIEGAGEILIRTENSPVKKIEISDTGRGIDEEDRKNIFTPFFSTKKNGQGIGLTMIREILMNHGFLFSLESGEKTVFTIYLD